MSDPAVPATGGADRALVRWLRRGPKRASFELLGLGLGFAAMKDLLSFPVFYGALEEPGRYVFPYLPVPRIPWTVAGARVAWGEQGVAWLGAVLLLTGAWPRAGSLLLLGCYGHAFLGDRLGYTNNGYLLLVLLAAHALGAGRDAALTAVVGRATQLFVASIYLTAAVTKLTPLWFSGELLREALFAYQPVYARWFGWDDPWLFRAGAAATVAGELTLALGLWNARTRRLAMLVGLGLHVGIEALLPVRFFSYLMVASYALFLAPGDARRLWALAGRVPAWARPLGALAAGAALDLAFVRLTGNYGVRADCLEPLRWALPVGLAALAWARWRERRSPPPRTRRGPGLRAVAALPLLVVLQACLLVRPAFGAPSDFAFRLFSGLTQLRVQVAVRVDGRWRPGPLYGAAHRWSDRYLVHTWDGWPDQRERLEDYARWLARLEDTGDRVRVVAHVSVDRGPVLEYVFEEPVGEPGAPAPGP